jgi:hypothetical protein
MRKTNFTRGTAGIIEENFGEKTDIWEIVEMITDENTITCDTSCTNKDQATGVEQHTINTLRATIVVTRVTKQEAIQHVGEN